MELLELSLFFPIIIIKYEQMSNIAPPIYDLKKHKRFLFNI